MEDNLINEKDLDRDQWETDLEEKEPEVEAVKTATECGYKKKIWFAVYVSCLFLGYFVGQLIVIFLDIIGVWPSPLDAIDGLSYKLTMRRAGILAENEAYRRYVNKPEWTFYEIEFDDHDELEEFGEFLGSVVGNSIFMVDPGIDEQTLQIISALAQAEAGNQPKKGIRRVIDTVLNRVDSDLFPDNIHDVIFEPGQFAVIDNGSFEYWFYHVPPYIYELVKEEYANRVDSNVLFFATSPNKYMSNAVYKCGDHYFGW